MLTSTSYCAITFTTFTTPVNVTSTSYCAITFTTFTTPVIVTTTSYCAITFSIFATPVIVTSISRCGLTFTTLQAGHPGRNWSFSSPLFSALINNTQRAPVAGCIEGVTSARVAADTANSARPFLIYISVNVYTNLISQYWSVNTRYVIMIR